MLPVVLAFFLIAAPAWAAAETESPTVTIHAITRLVPRFQPRFDELQRGDMVVLDLDNTVFREAQLLGTDEWYDFAISQITRTGLSKREASEKLEPLNRAIKSASAMKLMEPRLPQVLNDLQNRGVYVIGLTARHPKLAETTISHLKNLYVHFENSYFPSPTAKRVPGLENEFLFKDGIAFTDGSPKGKVLRFLIEEARVRPQRVIAADDRIHHVHTLVENLLDMGISGHVVHYLKVREEPLFDEDIVRIQQMVFETEGRLLSDDEARSWRDCQERLTGS